MKLAQKKYFSRAEVGSLVGKNLQVRMVIWPATVGESILFVEKLMHTRGKDQVPLIKMCCALWVGETREQDFVVSEGNP